MMNDRYAIPNPVTDAVLRGALLRIRAINALVLDNARVNERAISLASVALGMADTPDQDSTKTGIVSWPQTISGEMPCPECRRGSLCYLLGQNGGAFVECSTVRCLYWDARF